MIDIDKLIKELTIEEKISLLSGHKSWYTNKISRVNLPNITITDGPHGLRKRRDDSKAIGLGSTYPATAFPPAVTSSCSWNRELLYEMGQGMGKDCTFYNVNVILGPAVNIKKNPLCGRNFEYFSEDPYLTGLLGANLTKGIESQNVGTSVKHFACNNNEDNRYCGNSIVDDRALREIYLKGFEHIVKLGKPSTIMCSYNKINNEYASENKSLLTDILRDEWGFDGLVMSDWGAVNDRVKGLKAGLDLEMPGDVGFNRMELYKAIKSGELTEDTLNTAVRRVLNLINKTLKERKEDYEPLEENSALARKIAEESAVLLKNEDNILPLDINKQYLVIGEMFEHMRYQGAGSSLINPYKLITPKDAFDQNNVNYHYEKGYQMDKLMLDEKYIKCILEQAKDYDTILFFGGLTEDIESEGFDRKDMKLPINQIEILKKLLKLNKKIVFIMYLGSPVELDEIIDVNAILNMYLPGQEGGIATYNLLFGNTSPSGRLAETWPKQYQDVLFNNEYTKTNNDMYKESIFVGYRYYSTFNIPVRFPFGYGLSYAQFSYNDLKIIKEDDAFKITLNITNESDIKAKHTIMLYVSGPKSKLAKPIRELKSFEKISLDPHETKEISLYVHFEDLKYYVDSSFKLEKGIYKFEICKDANNVILSEEYVIENGFELASSNEYNKLFDSSTSIKAISDSDFEKIIGRMIKPNIIKRPYTINTSIKEFKTCGGRFIIGIVSLVFKIMIKFNKMGKQTPDKITKAKNNYFSYRTFKALSLRALSNASEGALSRRRAEGLLDIANNKPLRGIWKLITKEKTIKLPK